MISSVKVQPDLDTLRQLQDDNNASVNMYPVYAFLSGVDLTPHVAYLRLAQLNDPKRSESFLLESAKSATELDRYSFIGVAPRKVIKTGL